MAACDDCPVFPLNGGPLGTCLPPPVVGPLCVVPVVTGATPTPENDTCITPICVFLKGRCVAGVLTMEYYDGPSTGAVLVGPVGAFRQVRCPVDARVAGVATAANQALELAQLIAINAGIPAALGQTTMANSGSVAIASDQSPIPTNPLKRPATARQLPAIATSSSVQTTAGVLAVSMIARGADIRYRVTALTSTAVAVDHLIIQNERLDIAVPSAGFISAIRDAATSGVLEISELV